ncbi:MAG: YXWGXW repeat-containing protein [Chlamydiia bacterium]|nr:YXWGXW repeat-containing protein [Chlamydiia bacterium]
MGKEKISFLTLMVLLGISGFAKDVEPCEKGPVHEAYMVKENGEVILQAVQHAPPFLIEEKVPPQSDEETRWIPGYWDWSELKKDFVWVSGTWRRSPPGHEWIPGKWQQYREGWVRLRGFWTAVPIEEIELIEEPPPDQIDERIPSAPSSHYFWIPGYWHHAVNQNKYIWYSGRWERFSQEWIFVPAHHIWRPGGYLFIPSYWDWPLDQRGIAYACVYIHPSRRDRMTYLPNIVLESLSIIEMCYPFYPCYLCFYHHHWHFHHDFWVHWDVAPPWWGWEGWWCYTWFDQFWLFWWWCHPGFPNPFWIDDILAGQISPPSSFVINFMKKMPAPLIVSSNGIVSSDKLLEIGEKNDFIEKKPIIPFDRNEIKNLQEDALKKPLLPILYPKGPKVLSGRWPTKPHFGPGEEGLITPPRRVVTPQLPSALPSDSSVKKLKQPRKPIVRPTPYPQSNRERVYPLPEVRPQSTFHSQSQPKDVYHHPSVQSKIPQTAPLTRKPSAFPSPRYQMPQQHLLQPEYQRSVTPQVIPKYQQRSQEFLQDQSMNRGQLPTMEHSPLPRAQQNLGNYMNRPSPQINPGRSSQYP